MQVFELKHSLEAVKEAMRDGAKVYAIGSHEDGCGYWYEIRKSKCGYKLMHESGGYMLTSSNFDIRCKMKIVAIL